MWGRLCRTIRPLRTSQLCYRIYHRLRRPLEYGWFRKLLLPSLGGEPSVRPGPFAAPFFPRSSAEAEARARELSEARLTLLNEQLPFRGGEDWALTKSRNQHRLWIYTLHYHGWLLELSEAFASTGAAIYGGLLAHYLEDWLEVCRLGVRGFNHYPWNSYTIATRLGNWFGIYHSAGTSFWSARPHLRQRFLHSMALQAAYLENHLEWDLRGNHLLRDALGLAWAGRFFFGAEADRWLQRATRLAVEQVREQVLLDGAHFERSPMYHLHALEDSLKLALLVEDSAARTLLRNTAQRMAEYQAWLRHPDGEVALFNDGAIRSACEPGYLLYLAKHLEMSFDATPRRGGRYFPNAGMIAWHGQPWSLFFDVGEVGPDYQPGHGHADTLTVECSYQGQRLFVDPGTYGYDRDERRRYERSTAAHNTVCIDHQDSSEVWDIFRVGRRAYPVATRTDCSDAKLTAEASHTGYDHLPGQPRHQRKLTVASGELNVTDRIKGGGTHFVEGGFLLAPEWKARADGDGWMLTNGSHQVRLTVRGPDGLTLFTEPRPYYPRYGEEISTQRIGWRTEGSLPLEVHVRVEGL